VEALIDITCDPRAARRAVWEGRHCTNQVDFVQPQLWHDPKSGKTGYASVVIDGVTYNAGDCVIVRHEEQSPSTYYPATERSVH
jgi:hypothetical protein